MTTELRSQAFPTVFKPKWAVRLFIAERKLTLKTVTDHAQPRQPGMVGLTEAMTEQFNQWIDDN